MIELGVEESFLDGVLLWNSDIGNWLLLLIPIYVLSSFCLLKQQRNEWWKGKRQGYFWTHILFSGFKTILSWECFPERVEIAVLPVEAFEESRESFWQILNLRVYHVCLCSVGMLSWRCYEQKTQCVALANAYAPTGSREKKKRPFSWGMSSFSLAPGSPSF